MMNRRRFTATVAVAVSLSTAGCATNGLASLPLPHPGLSEGGYTLTAIFENALNVPALAKVRLAGADVGQLETLDAKDYTAVATLRIANGVQLPKGSTVELRSATPLGDVFIAVKPPANAPANGALLKDGDTIGLEDTAAAATVENLLTGAAVLVNGGAVQNLTDLINGAGKAAGEDGGRNFGRLVEHTNQLLTTMDRRTDQISDSIVALSGPADEPYRRPHRAGRCHHRPAGEVPLHRRHRHQWPQRHRRYEHPRRCVQRRRQRSQRQPGRAERTHAADRQSHVGPRDCADR
jgi:ABC-type transporter Mla subunit MlaD